MVVRESKGLLDALDNYLASDDRKSAVEMSVIEELLARAVGWMRWTPHNNSPSDALTKFRGAHTEPFMRLMNDGMSQLVPEHEELQASAAETSQTGTTRILKVSASTLRKVAHLLTRLVAIPYRSSDSY